MLDALVQTITSRDILREIYVLTCELQLQDLIQTCNRLFVEFFDYQQYIRSISTSFEERLREQLHALFELPSHPWDSVDIDLRTLELFVLFRYFRGQRSAAYQELLRLQHQSNRFMRIYARDVNVEASHRTWLGIHLRNRTSKGRQGLTRKGLLHTVQALEQDVLWASIVYQLIPRIQRNKWMMYQYVIGWIWTSITSWRHWFMCRLCSVPVSVLQLTDRLQGRSTAIRAFLRQTYEAI